MRREIWVLTFSLLLNAFANAESTEVQPYRASLALIPMHSEVNEEGKPRGGFVQVANALATVLHPNKKIELTLSPFARSLKRVQQGVSDFHIPLIRVPSVNPDDIAFSYVTEKIAEVSFVLYTSSDLKKLNPESLDTHQIETIRGHKNLFSFEIGEVDSIKQGIAKLLAGRSEGFIMEQDAVDAYLVRHKLKNIRRSLFAVWDSCIIIAKGPGQAELDQTRSEALRALKADGKLQAITQKIHQPYKDWQPYEMDW